jgi:pyruvate/2-oxoglutarate dehydrogenase complex dihydrolipoamide acyltransferase (E2) component
LQVENDLLVQQAAALDAELGRLAGQLEAADAEVAAAKAEAAAEVAAAASRAAGQAGKRSKALQERVKVWCWEVMGVSRDSMVAELHGKVWSANAPSLAAHAASRHVSSLIFQCTEHDSIHTAPTTALFLFCQYIPQQLVGQELEAQVATAQQAATALAAKASAAVAAAEEARRAAATAAAELAGLQAGTSAVAKLQVRVVSSRQTGHGELKVHAGWCGPQGWGVHVVGGC